MKNILILLAVILCNNQRRICMGQKIPKIPEDARLTTPELLKKFGYPVEIHTITTNDGYILKMHRIPHGRKGPKGKKRAVLLQHGLLGSSADWLNPGPEKGLGFILADAGYDVWLSNARGNRYSRNHTCLDPDRNARKFWDFSWHEIGIYDLPAQIDYIIKQTKQEKIIYIGFSQGTTVYYVMASEKPQYNNKVAVAISLAPVAYMKNMFSPILKTIAAFQGVLELILKWIGLNEFLPHSKLLKAVSNILCGDHSTVQILCSNTLFALVGFNEKQMNATLIPIMTGHVPAGGSTKQILHYGQLYRSGKFRQYDYGIKNWMNYGTLTPPKYNIEKISTPMYLFYSKNDWMSSYKDVQKLVEELPNLKGKFLVTDRKFNHLDYQFGIDAGKIVYSHLISLLPRH